MELLDAAIENLARRGALSRGDTVIVAVSGGCDSVALLHLLKRARGRLGIDLHVASLDHGLRGEAGRADLDFVAALASRWGIPFSGGRADVPRLAKEWRVGVEEAARRARYAFLARTARERGGSCVAVGHHALDQAETILMHIARGSGLAGLRGMRVVGDMPSQPGLRLLRPLLRVSKHELQAYCRGRDLPFRVDASNDDVDFARNYLRHEIIGPMARLNPDLLGAFGRLAEAAQVDEDFIATCFETAVMPLVEVSASRWRIAKADFAELRPAMRRRFIREGFRALSGGSALPHATTLDLVAWARTASVGDRRDLSAALRLRASYHELCLELADAVERYPGFRLIPADMEAPIARGDSLVVHDVRIRLSAKRPPDCEGAVCLALPAGLELRLRTRRPGDRFKPKGMAGRSRKLKDWMIDRKIPREIRQRIPLVCADGAIIAICHGADWHLAHIEDIAAGAADRHWLWLA